MGLDNGIQIRRKTATKEALVAFDDEMCLKYNYDPSVAYWRKCWNVRNIVFELLEIEDFNDSQTTMTADDVERVVAELRKLNSANFCDRGDCIWYWDDFKRFNRRNIKNLKRLARLMRKEPTMEVYFYDSW